MCLYPVHQVLQRQGFPAASPRREAQDMRKQPNVQAGSRGNHITVACACHISLRASHQHPATTAHLARHCALMGGGFLVASIVPDDIEPFLAKRPYMIRGARRPNSVGVLMNGRIDATRFDRPIIANLARA